MSLAEHAHTTPTAPASREDFDQALSQAGVITGIMDSLADHALTTSAYLNASQFAWLAEELDARLERIEVAEMTMRRAGA